MTAKTSVPAVEGWFTEGDEPRLIGRACTSCGTVVFPPPKAIACPNPGCDSDELEPRELSRRGRVWSYTTNHYAPPEPYVAPEPFEPYTVVAVELAEERMVVLGQAADGVDAADLAVGAEVELTTKTLFEDDEQAHTVWAWRPVAPVAGEGQA